ncbi:MAG: hypothetical protein LBH60_04880 [Prevotellaceae bacterium]|nr:hypothetical protein [Prevotellaceae bacterium]
MATVLESLKAVSGYPVPLRAFENAAVSRSLDLDAEATPEVLSSVNYRLAKADIMRWVSFAPNVSQGGTTYDMLYPDRQRLREEANAIYGELGDSEHTPETKTRFGYKSNRL